MNEREELAMLLTAWIGKGFLMTAKAIIAAGYRKQPTIDDAMVERVTQAIASEIEARAAREGDFHSDERGLSSVAFDGTLNVQDLACAALRAALEK